MTKMHVAHVAGLAGNRGFSLLEMLVALVILALSLGALYQAAGGATRIVAVDREYGYAIALAQSLMAERTDTRLDQKVSQGRSEDGYRWEVVSQPLPAGETDQSVRLDEIVVMVSWGSGLSDRQVVLRSVVSGVAPE